MDASIDEISKKRLALICVDKSINSEHALDFYLEHLHQDGNDVGLLHIHSSPDLPAFGDFNNASQLIEYTVYYKVLQDSIGTSRALINKFKDKCTKRGIDVKMFVETMDDSVGNTICKIANDQAAYLIVMGQRGVGILRRTLLGSVSHYVVHHTKTSVTIVPN